MTFQQTLQSICECCRRACDERQYVRSADEYWCPRCIDDAFQQTSERDDESEAHD